MSDSPYFRKLGDKIARIPTQEKPPVDGRDEADVVAAGTQIGFVNRDPDQDEDVDVRQPLGPVVMMTMRAPVKVARRFRKFCKENRYSYWEAIEELMKRAGA